MRVTCVLLAALVAVAVAQYGLPSGLPSPYLWVRGDSGIVLNSGRVVQWNDIRGNGMGLDEYSSGNDILLETGTQFNNQPVVRFQGRDNVGKSLLSRTKMGPQSIYIFAAMRMSFNGAYNGRLITSDIYVDGEFIFGYWPSNEHVWYYPPASNHYSTGIAATTNPNIYVGRHNTGASQLWKNGNLIWNDGGSANIPIRLQLGGLATTSVQQMSDGQIAEVIMFGDDLTTPQREAVQCYLSQRYNIAIAGPPCTTYCCQQVTDVCNSIQSRCTVISAAATGLHDLCIPGGLFCDLYNAAVANLGSCNRLYNTCHALNIAC